MKDAVLQIAAVTPWAIAARVLWKLPDWVQKWLDIRDRLRKKPTA
jgi:hypothetical protein